MEVVSSSTKWGVMPKKPKKKIPDPYETLGVDKDASPDEIKKTYRKKAMKHHPDKGGDPETFAALSLAYEILGDEKKRAEYDSTGKIRDEMNAHKEAVEVIGQMLQECLNQYGSSIFRVDIFEGMKRRMADSIHEAQQQGRRKAADAEDKIGHFERVLGKIKRSDKKQPPIIEHIMNASIALNKRVASTAKTKMEQDVKTYETAMAILENYEFECSSGGSGSYTCSDLRRAKESFFQMQRPDFGYTH